MKYRKIAKSNINKILSAIRLIMKKSYTFRLEKSLIEQLKTINSNKTQGVRDAITMYVNNAIKNNTEKNTEEIEIMKDYIEELKNDKIRLQQRLDYYQLGWFKRLLLKPKKY